MVRGDIGCAIGKDGRRDGAVLHTLLTDGLLERAGREERPADGSRNTGSGEGRGLHALLDGAELLLDAAKSLAGGGRGNVGNVVLLGGRDASVGAADVGGTAAASNARLIADDEILGTRCHAPNRRDTGIVAHQIARLLGIDARLLCGDYSCVVLQKFGFSAANPVGIFSSDRLLKGGRIAGRISQGRIVESLPNCRVPFRLRGLVGRCCWSRHDG